MQPYNSAAIKVPGDCLKLMSSVAPHTDAISNATSSAAPHTDEISNATSSAAPHTDAISNTSSPKQVCDTQKFTDEQLQLFEKRAEEGYNLYTDPAYVSWLEQYHPELLPSDRYSLVSVDTPEADSSDHELSVLQHFSAVVPESPLTVEGVTPPSVTPTQIASASTTPLHISSPGTAPNCVTPTVTNPHLTSSTLDPVSIADDTPHHISPSVATPQSSSASTTPYQVLPAGANSSQVTPGATSNPVTSTSSKSNQIVDCSSETSTVVSKYLIRPSDTPSTKRSLPRARLLTSASVLAALEEKERNKRQAIEEKEKRKIER